MPQTAFDIARARADAKPITAKARGERFRARVPSLRVHCALELDTVPPTWEWELVERALERSLELPERKGSKRHADELEDGT